jgi:hypothetical protein
MAAPSSVNKAVANLWACRAEIGGPMVTEELADGSRLIYPMLHYTVVPGTEEIYIDAVLRQARGRSTLGYVREHAVEIADAYMKGLEQALTGCFGGLRQQSGDLVFALFGVQLLFCLARRDEEATHTFAIAGAALGHYFGPVVLLAGDAPTHYLLVALPLFVLVAARGALHVAHFGARNAERLRAPRSALRMLGGVCLLLIAYPSVGYYHGAATLLHDLQKQAVQEQAALDALKLDGLRVACRNMSWFVDRNVQTVLLPYATVPELEKYVQVHRLDGILVWGEERMTYFRASPYGSPADFGRALENSSLFGHPQLSRAWSWYPVRSYAFTEEQR